MRRQNEEGELMGPGVDLAMSLSGILMIIVFVTIAQLWTNSMAKRAQAGAPAGESHQQQIAQLETQRDAALGRLRQAEVQLQDKDVAMKVLTLDRDRERQRANQLDIGLTDERRRRERAENIFDNANQQIARLIEQREALEHRLNDKPPLITISDATFRTFEEASAEIRPELSEYLRTIVPTLYKLGEQYDARVIEVIGHTDEVRIGARRRQSCNLDSELLPTVNGQKSARLLEPCDNVGLGMARAVAVVNVLRALGLGSSFTLLPLSAGQAIDTDGSLAAGAKVIMAEPARRRIEIRLRRHGE
jgi:flagellar motor protein MotB